MTNSENIGMNRIFNVLKGKKMLIVFILTVFTLLGYLYSFKYVVPKYKSTLSLLLIPNSESEIQTITNSDLTLNSSLISTYSNIAKNNKVLKKVISNLNLKMTEEELSSKIEVRNIKNTYIIEIAVTHTNPKEARTINNELSNVFLEEIKNIYHLNNVGIIDVATLPEEAFNVNHVKNISIFLIMGLFVSIVAVMIINVFDNTIETQEELERYLQVKTLGSIPLNQNKKEEIIDKNNSKSYVSECINTIRTNILYMNGIKNAKSMLITSCTPGEGKSWVSSNIAISFSDINKRVLLIDTDLRRGRINKIFGISNNEGLSEYLSCMTGNARDDLSLAKKYIKETKISNLHVLTNGSIPQNPSELLVSDKMKELMELMKSTYDIVIVDAPPSKIVTDGVILSTIVDSTILVVNSNKTSINDLKEVKKSINLVGGEVIGAILNKVKIATKEYNKKYYKSTKKGEENNFILEQKNVINVEGIINQSIINLENKGFILPENKKTNKYEDIKSTNIDELIKRQNEHLEEISSKYNKISHEIENIQVNINNKVQGIIENNESILDNVDNKIQEILENNNNTFEKVQENVNSKVQEIVNSNELNIEKVKENINNKVEEILQNNSNNLEKIQENVSNKVQEAVEKHDTTIKEAQENINSKIVEIVDNNHNTIEEMQGLLQNNNDIIEELKDTTNTLQASNINIEDKVQQILNNNNNIIETSDINVKKIEEVSSNIEKMTEDFLDNKEIINKINKNIVNIDEKIKDDNKIVEEIKSQIDYKTKEILEENKNSINTLKSNLNQNKSEITSKSDDNAESINNNIKTAQEEINEKIAQLNIENKIGQILNDNLVKIEKEICNINYSDKLEEINKVVEDLKNNYTELYNMVKSGNIKYSSRKNDYYGNIVDIRPFRKHKLPKAKRKFNIKQEEISYNDLERNAICIVPLNFRKIREFRPQIHENMV